MVTIHKYQLPAPDTDHRIALSMPTKHRVVSAGRQGDNVVVWAMVDTSFEYGDVTLLVFNTGEEIPVAVANGARFVGTVQVDDIVWHVFEEL